MVFFFFNSLDLSGFWYNRVVLRLGCGSWLYPSGFPAWSVLTFKVL